MTFLHICSDHGIPVLRRKKASVHARCLVAALTGAGKAVLDGGRP